MPPPGFFDEQCSKEQHLLQIKNHFITLDQFNASLLYENINLFPGQNLLTLHLTFEL